jgi:molybdate transport system permease protein
MTEVTAAGRKAGLGADPFRWLTTGVLVVFTVLVSLLFIADLAFVDRESLLEIVTMPHLRSACALSLITSIIATVISVLVAVPAAYALSRYRFRGIIVLDVMVDLLIVMPVLVIGVSLLVFFRVGRELGQSNVFLVHWLGWAVGQCGDFFIYSRPGIVLAQFFCSASYAIRTIKAAFDEIDPRTEQVAMTLGCSRAGAFRRVTLPLAKEGILAGTVLAWVRAFGIFGPILIVAGGVRGKTEVLPTSIYLEISIGRLEAALAISLLMVVAAAAVLLALRGIAGKSVLGVGGTK